MSQTNENVMAQIPFISYAKRLLPKTLILRTVLACVIAGFIFSLSIITYVSYTIPLKENFADGIKVWVEDNNIHLWYSANKKRDCRIQTSIMLWRPISRFDQSTNQIINIANFITPHTTVVDTGAFEEVVAIPTGISGNWNYKFVSISDCDWFSSILPSPVFKSPSYPIVITNNDISDNINLSNPNK